MYLWELPGAADVLVVQLSRSHSTEAGVALVEVGPLTEDVNHDHDQPVHIWRLQDEVNQDGVPALFWNPGQMKLTVGKALEPFRPIAHIAGSDVVADVSGQLEPPVVLGDEFQSLEAASIPGNLYVGVLHHDLTTEVLILQHNNFAAEQEESILDLPLGRVGGWSLPVLEEFPSDRILKIWLGRNCLPNIAKEQNLRSVNRNSFRCHMEELGMEEHDVRVFKPDSQSG
jgi:hypothetical protein